MARKRSQERRGEPVDEARGVGFAVAEEIAESTADEFLRRDRDRKVDGQTA